MKPYESLEELHKDLSFHGTQLVKALIQERIQKIEFDIQKVHSAQHHLEKAPNLIHLLEALSGDLALNLDTSSRLQGVLSVLERLELE